MEIKITGLKEEEAKAVEEIIRKIAENKDTIDEFLDVINKLRDTGALSAISALAEGFEEGFNSVVKPEIMGSVANIMMLVWLMGNLDHEILFSLAQKVPEAINKSKEEIQKAKEEKPSIFKLIKIMKSPEFFTAVKTMQIILSNLSSNGERK